MPLPPPSSSTTTLLVSTFAPFSSVAFDLPDDTLLCHLPTLLSQRFPHLPVHHPSLAVSSSSGPVDYDARPIAALFHGVNPGPISLRLTPRLVGGKGGFGSQLRAAGGRMSSQKTSNNDSCRDLSGRRLSTVKEAIKMVEYIENESARKKAEKEAQKTKLEALERQLGIDGPSSGGAESSSAPAASKKHRFDDTEYLEQSRDIVDGVKNAVAAGLLKKRKKAKLDVAPVKSETSPTAAADAVKGVVEKVVKSPETPIVTAVGEVAAA